MSVPEDERFVESGDARLWSVATGSGTPLLMFNGGPGCDDYLGPLAELISDRCEVVRFEPRGCGRSAWDGRYDVETLLSDAEAIRHAYRFDKCIVAGHSAGPGLALAYSIRYPERVVGVIGVAGGKMVDDRQWSEVYRARLEAVGEDTGGKQFHADPDVNPRGNASWREYCRRPTLFRELADLKIPCVFINGGEDIRPNWPTQQLAELVPNARYIEIPGAAHTIWLSHADELRKGLRDAISYILDFSAERNAAPPE
jgi:proline iminopeptidase